MTERQISRLKISRVLILVKETYLEQMAALQDQQKLEEIARKAPGLELVAESHAQHTATLQAVKETLEADGIIVEKRSGRRFVPYKDLKSISTTDDRVTLRLHNGKKVSAKARHLGQEEQDIIQQRVREALALRDERSADLAAFVALDRGHRDIKAWREALSRIFGKEGGYRQAKLTLEQIAAVLVDPVAPVERRIGAAMVLSQSGDGEAKTKIRAAIESSVNRKVRVALEAIERGDLEDAAIEEAAMLEAESASSKQTKKR